MRRVFLIVLDSFGIGELPDAAEYKDEGSNTLAAVCKSKYLSIPILRKLGLFNIEGLEFLNRKVENPIASFARAKEVSKGKDTTTGHWEIAGLKSFNAFPVYKEGFPQEIISEFESLTKKKVLCNKPYSGTEVIKDYGLLQIESKGLIVYTSADSVFQIAAHEDVIPVEELYEYCKIARSILKGEHSVGRVIARPFAGKYPNFYRTPKRHDFSLEPPGDTLLDLLKGNGKIVKSVGKIFDIFAGRGITESHPTANNAEGIAETLKILKEDFEGLCFVNLVDFDMLYGHRNDVDGYAKALSEFDCNLNDILKNLNKDDILIITADHGCDPSTESTDHSREYIPVIIYGEKIIKGKNLGTRESFADIGSTILDYFCFENNLAGKSFLKEMGGI